MTTSLTPTSRLRCTAAIFFALLAAWLLAPGFAFGAEKPTINITAYNIDAEIDPDAHTLKATARVTFTALEPVDTVVFQLHGALKVDKVTDAANHVLSGERGTDATIRLALPAPLVKGQKTTFTFEYGGVLSGSEESPVEGLKLASIGTPISYLFYPARWFPMTGYLTDRFTADIHMTVPLGYRVIGSGAVNPLTQSGGTFEFRWDKPGFPGTIIAGKFNPPLPGAQRVVYPHLDDRCPQSTGPGLRRYRSQGVQFLYWHLRAGRVGTPQHRRDS